MVKLLLWLRAMPAFIAGRGNSAPRNKESTLQTLIDSGFGLLSESPSEEIVLGVTGRFWRPTGNLSTFKRADFDHPVPSGLARESGISASARVSQVRQFSRPKRGLSGVTPPVAESFWRTGSWSGRLAV